MIKSFKDDATEAVFNGYVVRRLPLDIHKAALRKLRQLDAAQRLDDLRIPPANRLEALKHERAGQHSIRINSQWRLCFHWHEGHALDVEITDYH